MQLPEIDVELHLVHKNILGEKTFRAIVTDNATGKDDIFKPGGDHPLVHEADVESFLKTLRRIYRVGLVVRNFSKESFS